MSCAGEWETRLPVRRPAYESATVRHIRISLELLDKCLMFLQTDSGIGSFSHPLEITLAELRKRRFAVPIASRAELISWVEVQIARLIPVKRAAMKEMREERKARFKAGIPRLYEERPGCIYRWLEGDSPAWGSFPILLTSGHQCTTPAEVDAAVQDFWVRKIWRKNAALDESACWQRFADSKFFAHIPRCEFPHEPWTLERVRRIVGHLREGSAPGVRGIPISLWKCLPDSFLQNVAT